MSGVTMKVRNKDRLFAKLRASVPGIEKAVTEANSKTAAEMVGLAQRFAPVDTGALRDSITVTYAGQSTPAYSQPGGSTVIPDGAAMVTAGNAAVRYPHLVEYGTAEATAQPFFWPAYRLVSKKHRSRVSRAIGKELKKLEG